MPRLLRIPPPPKPGPPKRSTEDAAKAALLDVVGEKFALLWATQEVLARQAEEARQAQVAARAAGCSLREIAEATGVNGHAPISAQTVSNQTGEASNGKR